MRKQIDTRRFGLIFGAGLSKGFNLPTWSKLVDDLASDPEVDGKVVLDVVPPRAGLPYQTEMLFEHYRQKRYVATIPEQHNTREVDFKIGADWRELIRKHLYSELKDDIGDALDKHPYLKQYIPLIKRTSMTVTYNFDDFLEQALLRERKGSEDQSLGFESVTNPWVQFRRTNAVIYHPNGVIPQNPLETPSDRFVFSEQSYVKQLMGIYSGDQAGLVNHLSKNTCLLIGLSLEDDTLRNVLTQAAHSCPGSFHYYIHYLPPGGVIDDATRKAITKTNFKVYNLITLFLDDSGIKAIGELINTSSCEKNKFCDFAAEHNIKVRFRFYITGALGVGKSTLINHFRNLDVLDEWIDHKPAILAKRWDLLTPEEKIQADDWIINQFKKKNDKLRNEREGIFILDRGPLDPMTFTHIKEWKEKANNILKALCPGNAQWHVEGGRVILLQGDSNELSLRMLMTKREDYTAERLANMDERLKQAYGTKNVMLFDTRGLTPSDVANRLGDIIHLEDYSPVCNLHERLETLKKEGFDVDK